MESIYGHAHNKRMKQFEFKVLLHFIPYINRHKMNEETIFVFSVFYDNMF